MRIDIHGEPLFARQSLREYVERALFFALGRFAQRIRRVRVNLADVNGPRGGDDKRCRIRVDMGRMGTVVSEDTDAQVRVAIDNASERAGRRIGRAMERRLEGRREPPASRSGQGSIAGE